MKILLNLLCCRTKIIYVYYQAQRCNEEARKLYSQLEEKVEEFSNLKSDKKERLQQLEKLLTELPQIGLNYARYLRDIELHLITIETNAYNYRNCHKELVSCSVKEIDNLDFIQDFYASSCKIFQKQIKVNMSYLTVGRQLFQQMMETIRGIVEIEQAESDRNLQKTIQAVGFGIGAAGVVATSTPYLIKQEPGVIGINKPLSFSALATFILIIFLSLSAGLLTWGIASGVMNGKGSIAGGKQKK
jgi:hypothetical protein